MTVTIVRDTTASTAMGPDQVADHDGTGLYSVTVTPAQTNVKDEYTATWVYMVGGIERQFVDKFVVTDPMPYWDALTIAERETVMSVYHKISQTFDSREGGPYLWEVYQSNFNAFETIARLMATDAVTYVNLSHQPAFVPGYAVGQESAKPFPVGWMGLLERATYVELLRHLSRSYIEIPTPQGITTARLDRQRYRDEWAKEAVQEQAILDRMLMMFKRKFLVGTKRALLVAGGNVPTLLLNPTQPNYMYTVARW